MIYTAGDSLVNTAPISYLQDLLNLLRTTSWALSMGFCLYPHPIHRVRRRVRSSPLCLHSLEALVEFVPDLDHTDGLQAAGSVAFAVEGGTKWL